MKKDLGFVFVLVLVLLFSQFQVVEADDGWDKSSLSFVAGCGVSCDQIEVTVCNTGDGDMTTEVPWELWYAVSGNPKNGEIIATGMLS